GRQKEANRASHRYNRLPLLPSGPGGFSRSWSCRFARRKGTKKSVADAVTNAKSGQSGKIQVELHGAGFIETIGFEVFQYVLVEGEFPSFDASVVETRKFDAGQANGI